MAEYYSKSTLLSFLRYGLSQNSMLSPVHIERMLDCIPTVDAEPVVHGRWGEDGECSKCGFQPWYEHDIHTLSYCPNCGAKMDADKYLAFADQSGAEYADNPTV